MLGMTGFSVLVAYAASTLVANLFTNSQALLGLAFGTIPFAVVSLVLVILTKWMVLGRLHTGLYPGTTWNRVRLWFVDTLMQNFAFKLSIITLLDPTVGIPTLLKLFGAQIGQGVCLFYPEFRVGMELVSMDDRTMFGGQVMPLCMDWHHCDHDAQQQDESPTSHPQHHYSIALSPIAVGKGCFVANFVVLQRGVVLAENVTLGMLSTVPPYFHCEVDSAYAGSPAMVVSTTRDDEELQTELLQQMVRATQMLSDTDVPADGEWSLGESHPYIAKFVMSTTHMIPGFLFAIILSSLYFGTGWIMTTLGADSLWAIGLILALNFILTILMALATALTFKKLLCPVFKGKCKLMSYGFLCWTAFGQIIAILSATVVGYIKGTALMALWLRGLGAKVGDGVYFDTGVPTETDCLEIGDGVTILEAPQSLVPHAMDRGMLQFAPIKIGHGASLGINTCLNLQCTIEDGAAVGPSSVGMKGETVLYRTYSVGNPLGILKTAPVSYAGLALGQLAQTSVE